MADEKEVEVIHGITGVTRVKQTSQGRQVTSKRSPPKGATPHTQDDVVTISSQGKQAEEEEEQREAQAEEKK